MSGGSCARIGATSCACAPLTSFASSAGGAAVLANDIDEDAAARSGAAFCANAVVVLPSRIKVNAKTLFIACLERWTSRLWEKPPYYGKQQIVLLSTFFVAAPYWEVGHHPAACGGRRFSISAICRGAGIRRSCSASLRAGD